MERIASRRQLALVMSPGNEQAGAAAGDTQISACRNPGPPPAGVFLLFVVIMSPRVKQSSKECES